MLTPTRSAPMLTVATENGGRWDLATRAPEHFTMIVFYRGKHCPVCKSYLETLRDQLAKLDELGVDVIAVSGDERDVAEATRREWAIDGLTLGCELPEQSMREWGLYRSRSIKDAEPDLFSEPALFLVRPDGTIYYAAYNSMPFGRPDLEDFVKSIAWVLGNAYPPRGEVHGEILAGTSGG